MLRVKQGCLNLCGLNQQTGQEPWGMNWIFQKYDCTIMHWVDWGWRWRAKKRKNLWWSPRKQHYKLCRSTNNKSKCWDWNAHSFPLGSEAKHFNCLSCNKIEWENTFFKSSKLTCAISSLPFITHYLKSLLSWWWCIILHFSYAHGWAPRLLLAVCYYRDRVRNLYMYK